MSWESGTTIAANIATIIAAIVAIGTLIYIARQARTSVQMLKENREKTRKELTTNMLMKFNDATYTNHLTNAIIFLRDETKSIQEKKDIVTRQDKDGINLNLSIRITLNFFEQLGLWYNKDIIERDLVRDFIKTASLKYYDQSRWYIDKVREKFSPTIYTQWEKMNEDLREP